MNKEFSFSGIVKKNLGRGKKLGFPTANMKAPEEAEDGIYLGYCHSVPNDSRMPCLIFIGEAETFGDAKRQAEVYILDYSDDLYGKELKVDLLKKIRDNQKFDSERELVEQMKQDEKVAREFFSEYNQSN